MYGNWLEHMKELKVKVRDERIAGGASSCSAIRLLLACCLMKMMIMIEIPVGAFNNHNNKAVAR